MRRANRPIRLAYTLLEIVLVIALILIAAAISVPVIQAMLDDAHMSAAADMVRAKSAETRALAMESGRPWRLAYIPNTGVFQMAPEDAAEWEGMEQTPIEQVGLFRDELPKDIVFAVSPNDIAGSKERGTPGTEWHTIAVYLFDGSAREDSTTYFGKMALMPMSLDLRGLTGTVTVRSAAEVKAAQP